MTEIKIVPVAANACKIEIYEYMGEKGEVLTGILEIHSWNLGGRSRLAILRREREFAKFNVIDNSTPLQPKLLGSTSSIHIEFPK